MAESAWWHVGCPCHTDALREFLRQQPHWRSALLWWRDAEGVYPLLRADAVEIFERWWQQQAE